MNNNFNMIRNSFGYNNFIRDPYFMNNNMISSNSNNMELSTPDTGYSRGNLFSNLYSGYKNYNPRELISNDPKTKLWLDMSENFFAMHEINLYLDINPDDTSMIRLFNDYRIKANKLKDEYEEKYGALCTNSDTLNTTPFLWVQENFPWGGNN